MRTHEQFMLILAAIVLVLILIIVCKSLRAAPTADTSDHPQVLEQVPIVVLNFYFQFVCWLLGCCDVINVCSLLCCPVT